MYHILFIHVSIGGHLVYFYVLAIVSNATGDMKVQISIWNSDSVSFR